MTKLFAAIALSMALPAMAHAQAAPASAPAPKADCCAKMKAEGMECCCKDMAKMDHAQPGKAGAADPHAGHDMPGGGAHAGH